MKHSTDGPRGASSAVHQKEKKSHGVLQKRIRRNTNHEKTAHRRWKRKLQKCKGATPKSRWEEVCVNVRRSPRQKKHVVASFTSESRILSSNEETIYTCEKCGSSNIDMYQKQLRGADEPMTCFFTCKKCHKRWRDDD